MKADGVFEGGGMRGVAIIGALSYFEKINCNWQRIAGTSVGAIIAALLAAGYTAEEMKDMLKNTNFLKFLDRDGVQKLPIVGVALGFIMDKGIYSGDYFEKWMEDALNKKGVSKFKDVYVNGEGRLKIVASDITRKDILILPDDLIKYDIDPLEFSIAKAVRMSISIPFYFKPVELKYEGGTSYIVDGSICCNFPIDIFDVEGEPRFPTFGFKFDGAEESFSSMGKTDAFSFMCDIAGTMAKDNEKKWREEDNRVRTISIPTEGVNTTDFHIPKEKIFSLYKGGYKAAEAFMKKWDFLEYKKKYRKISKINLLKAIIKK